MRGMTLLFVAVVMLVSVPCAALAQVRILHAKVVGAIDCRRMADDLGAELDRAKAAGVGLIVLELDGKTARIDVVWSMAQRLRESGIESAAILGSGPGSSIGLGQAALGMLTDHPFIKPRTRIAGSSSDRRRVNLAAPPETEWAKVDAALTDAITAKLSERLNPEDRAEIALSIVSPTTSVWFVEGESALEVVSEQPASESMATQIVRAAGEDLEVDIDAPHAVKIGIVRGTASSVGEVLAALKVKPSGRESRTIASGLHAARTRAVATLQDAAVQLQRVKAELDVKKKHDRTITDRDYREAGQAALDRISAIETALETLDRALVEYPELLVFTRPAGSRSTRPPADSIPGRLDDVRGDLEKLKTTAQEYATRP